MNAVLSHKKQLEEFNVMEIERKFCKLTVWIGYLWFKRLKRSCLISPSLKYVLFQQELIKLFDAYLTVDTYLKQFW